MLSPESIATLNRAIEARDVATLRDWLGNLDNKDSRALFASVTGQPLPKTKGATLDALDSFCGVTPEERAKIDAQRRDALEREKQERELTHNRRKLESCLVNGVKAHEWADSMLKAGFASLIKGPKGYALVNAQGAGFNLTKIKGFAPELRAYIAARLALGIPA